MSTDMHPGHRTCRRTDGSQVDAACRAVLRLIASRELRRGDSLPGQRELCAQLGASNNSLTPAMRRLIGAGVIERRTKTGTFVADPEARCDGLWRVGVAENFDKPRNASPFFSLLASCVQHELILAGCRLRLYFRTGDAAARRTASIWSQYRGLASDVKMGRLDGVLFLGLPGGSRKAPGGEICVCRLDEWASCGASIDFGALTREAALGLTARGCRRLAVVIGNSRPSETRARAGLDEVGGGGTPSFAAEFVTMALPRSRSITGTHRMQLAGRRVARALLDRPKARRPDGVIMADDYAAAGLTDELRRAGGYRPRIAVLSHVQNSLIYALPVLRFEVDIAELAASGTAMLIERLRNPERPDRMVWVTPRLNTEHDGSLDRDDAVGPN